MTNQSNASASSSTGISALGLIFAVLFILKVAGLAGASWGLANLSWWWVFLPVFISFAIVMIALFVLLVAVLLDRR